MPILYEPGEPVNGNGAFETLEAQAGPTGLQGPTGQEHIYGTNAFNKMLTGLARDVPRDLRKATAARRAIRALTR